MKKALFTIVLTVSVLGIYAQETDEQKALLSIEKQRTDAIAAHNAAFLSNLFDDAFSGVTAAGTMVQKAEQLVLYKDRNSYVVYSNEDVKVTVYGNAAIVTGKQVTKSKAGSTLGQTRYLFVYSKLSDQWKIVLGQETDVIKKD